MRLVAFIIAALFIIGCANVEPRYTDRPVYKSHNRFYK